MFAPLSPTSSRRLARIRKTQHENATALVPVSSQPVTDHVYDIDNDEPDPEPPRRRRRRRRRNSDPSSNRPNIPSKHRRRQRTASRSPSPDSSGAETEILPDRFDAHGRPLDSSRGFGGARGGGGGEQEMVERFVVGGGDVVEGRKSWKELLRGVLDGGSSSDLGSSGSGRRRRR